MDPQYYFSFEELSASTLIISGEISVLPEIEISKIIFDIQNKNCQGTVGGEE